MKTKLRNWLVALVAAGAITVAVIRQAAIDAGLDCDDAQAIANVICAEQTADCLIFVERIVPDVCSVSFTANCAEMPSGDLCRFGSVVSGPSWTGKKPIPSCDPALGRAIPCVSRGGVLKDPRRHMQAFDADRVRAAIKRIRDRVDSDLAEAIPDV